MDQDNDSAAVPQFELLQRFLAAFECYATVWRTRLDVTANEHRVLLQLAVTPLTSAELSKRIGITTASMSVLVGGLTDRGLIRRVPHPTDRRQIILYATKAAMTLDTAATDDIAARLHATFDAMPERDRAKVGGFFERMTSEFNSVAGFTS